ncbi:hypothetical protein [Streptomyces sp. AK08-02]|uniref:hypothetical protein n=1 Tax=Streptomyces sp. AK08-02 TaxID=3028654 RepID=UPI0029ADB47E|nr:hypothetical protein [Streptomyces sp. AK08-02]MDX3750117.1 hypothetical protein [Streptomyces sp. AK08-02]
MPSHPPDFRLGGYQAVNDRVDDQFWQHIGIEEDQLTVLAEHHTSDGRSSFFVLHNGAVTWGIPGEPQLVALYLQRDTVARTFRFDHAELPLPVMAQSWLIARGCPEEKILLSERLGGTPSDDATRALEARLRGDGDHFALLTSYTRDDEPFQTTVLLRALDERVPLPFRVLLEEVDTDTWTRTLREGGFATFEAATTWWEAHWSGEDVPLPTTSPTTRHSTPPAAAASAVPPSPRRPGH